MSLLVHHTRPLMLANVLAEAAWRSVRWQAVGLDGVTEHQACNSVRLHGLGTVSKDGDFNPACLRR
jgi:predicted nuclease of predicted toxin-antitoxin system